MTHAILLPILIPMFLGAALLIPMSLRWQRLLLITGSISLLPIAAYLLQIASQGELHYYALGGWEQPFGISLMLDRLSALMLTLVALLAIFSSLYAARGDDEIGRYFHPLFAFQLMGLNGAFLTADMFNLFVFFEILLIASYSLLMHGYGVLRVRAGTHYVLLNLIGSSFFLIGLGIVYATSGTLSMAELSLKVASATLSEQRLYAAGGLLLLVVFGLKGALLPLYFWLPKAYSTATAPVAALFAIMTKVGIYAMFRIFTQVFGATSGQLQEILYGWMWPLTLLTIFFAAIGLLASSSLKIQISYLVIISSGTLQATLAMGHAQSIAAGLFYLIHSTLITAGFFFIADMIARERGEKRTTLVAGPPLRHPMLLGGLFVIAALGIAGIPPLSGFIGKANVLISAQPGPERMLLWATVLTGSLAAIVALSRAGSTLVWRTKDTHRATTLPLDGGRLACCIAMLVLSVALVIFAQPVMEYTQATAAQLLDVASYQQIITSSGGTP